MYCQWRHAANHILRVRAVPARNYLSDQDLRRGTHLALRPGMAFRVWNTTQESATVVAFEGHLDEEAMAAIERALSEARRMDTAAHLRLTRGTTAERAVVARLAAYDPGQLQVESPFLRAWIDEWRDTRKDEAR